MTTNEELAARLRNESGAATADVNDRVRLMDEAADALEQVTAQRKELAEKHRRVEKFLRMEREAGREQRVRAESAERRIEKVEDFIIRHYLDTRMGETVLAALNEGGKQ